jgi:hypothetical protein
MEQIIAQNAQSENPAPQQPMQQPMPQQMQQQMPQQMEDTGVAQLPIPEREYAGGGIIAFADGGLSDEDQDYEDSLEEADYNSMIERAMNAGEDDYTSNVEATQAPSFETRQAAGSPQSFPNSSRDVGIASGRESGDMDARLRAAIMQKESGGRRYDKEGRLLTSNKGAEGEMQVMPNTAKDPGFGIKPARDNSPDELKRVGDEYASVLLRRYRDPTLAMIAYNMGPGATDKWLAAGADPRKLPKETQGYIKNVTLAGGGEVRHFAGGGDTMGGFGEEDYGLDTLRIQEMAAAKKRKEEQEKYEFLKQSAPDLAAKMGDPDKPVLKNTPARSNAPTDQEFRDFDQAAALFQAENMGKNAPEQAQTKEAPKSRLDEYMNELMTSRADLKKQKTQDANLALLSAGLGMMGGTSRYALENIGKGALAGVQNFSESSKQRAAEKAALDKSILYGTRYQGAEELNKQNAQFQRGMKERQYALDVKKQGTEEQKIAINQYETHINNAIKSLDKNSLLLADPAARAAAEAEILNRPQTRALYQRAYGNMPMESATTFTPEQKSLLSKYLPR